MVTTTSAPGVSLRERAPRLHSLTGLRWVAAVLVFLFHLGYVGGATGLGIHSVVGRAGHAGLSFFFILSGFVLTWGARPGDTARGFWRGRLVKVFPNHWVTFLVTAVLMVMAGEVLFSGPTLANLFLVQTWVPNLDFWISMNAPSWSLTCELFFYALFPVLLWAINKIPAARLWLAAGLSLATIVAAPLLVELLVSGTPKIPYPTLGPVSFEQLWLVYWFPPVRMLEFVFGIILARVVLSGKFPRLTWVPVTAVFVVFQILAMNSPSYLLGLVALPSLSIVLLIPYLATKDIRGEYTPFRGRWMVWLGEASFAFYLLHKIVMSYGQQLISGDQWDAQWSLAFWLGFGAVVFGITLALAAALHMLVERPLMRRFARPKKKQPVAVAPVEPTVEPPVEPYERELQGAGER
jgi:peptidoglycan/LPS O-acetylase OafA/YrhL